MTPQPQQNPEENQSLEVESLPQYWTDGRYTFELTGIALIQNYPGLPPSKVYNLTSLNGRFISIVSVPEKMFHTYFYPYKEACVPYLERCLKR